jgi:quinol monooxygenase YgiN
MSQRLIVEYFVKDQASAATFRAIAKGRRSTMRKAGCKKIGQYVNQDDLNHIVTTQKWVSREHHAKYLKWAQAQPTHEDFHACWVNPPRLTWVEKTKV